MRHLGDITKINGAEIEPVDCITFGSPCQDLSIAGKRAGLAGERSGLFMEAVRIIKEMRKKTNGVYPTFAVWENVAGAFSSNKGEDFRAVLEELAHIREPSAAIPGPEKKWQHSGFVCGDDWSIAWRLLDAQFWGVPQRRKRIALVVDLGGQRAGEILFERESLPGHSEPSIPAWKNSAAYPKDRAGAGYIPYTLKIRGGCAGGGKGALIQTDKSATLSTLQDQTLFQPTYSLQGNGIGRSDTAGCCGKGFAEDVNYTLNTTDRHAVVYGVAYGIDSLSSNSMKSSNPHSGFHETDKAKTLDCTGPDPTKNQGGVAICQAYAIDCRNATINQDVNGILQAKESGGYNMNSNNVVMVPCAAVASDNTNAEMTDGGVSPTLLSRMYKGMPYICGYQQPIVSDAGGNGDGKTVPTITGDHENRVTDYTALAVERAAVFDGERRHNYEPVGDTHPTLQAAMGTGGGNTSIVVEKDAVAFTTEMTPKTDDKGIAFSLRQRDYKDPQSVAYCVQNEIRWIVRRLTPLECERLQGFPDNWTLIGEWIDTKGKKHKEADTPRYKALGNSIALPQWWWLTQKMKPYLPDHAKLGSLFDGIGGFPLVWETGYGKGTARWASEIEEFPIAVTKYHFQEEEAKC